MVGTNEPNAWSSDESEPEGEDIENFSIPTINYEDLDIIQLKEGDPIIFDSEFHPSIKDFTGPGSIREEVSFLGNSPIDFFYYFFDASLLENIVAETNLYQQQNPEPDRSKMKAWIDLTVDELKKFLGLSILMGHVRKGNLNDYWSTDILLSTPIFGKIMPRNRYQQILRFLHFKNNLVQDNHTLKKIKPIIDSLKTKFKSTIHPGKNVCIDESLMLWKGRLKFKQYLPLKRHRFGIKLFELVDCETGFILDFVIYTGNDTDYDQFQLGVTGDIVANFLQPYFFKGHVIYIDNWYSSPILAEFLHDRDTGICGTVKSNRKGMPELKDALEKNEVQIAHTSTWLVIKWKAKEKTDVHVITTVHEPTFSLTGKNDYHTGEAKTKPACILDYNKYMGGIDLIDKQLALTETVRKSMKWYRKLFLHLVDLALCNAHALYKIKNSKISFPSFRLQVVRSLLNYDFENETLNDVSAPSRLIGQHFPKKIQKRRRCHLCSLRTKRQQTFYLCSKCDTALCLEGCFEEYHTKQHL